MPIRRLAALAFGGIALAAACASPALAAENRVAGEPGIELVNGSGRASLSLEGATLGTLDTGRITVWARPRRNADVTVVGYEWSRRNGNSTTFGGRNLRFRVSGGPFRVTITGKGLDASAVGDGTIGLRGRGRYTLNGVTYIRWPSRYRIIELGEGRRNGAGR